MSQVRIFQIPIEDAKKIVYIPELLKLYIVPMSTKIPLTLNIPAHIPKTPISANQNFHRADLILNNFCNLRCIYCYSDAGTPPRAEMSPIVAKKAIDKVIEACLQDGESKFGITLTGGGEPLLSFKLVEQIVNYCRKRSSQTNLQCKLAIVSNGNFSKRTARYLSKNFTNISISVDGMPDIHNQHRPTIGGKESFDLLARNVDYLIAQGKIGIGFRMTISSLNVETLPEQILYLHGRWPNILISIEPLEQTGRCGSTQIIAPDPMKFAKYLIRAIKVAKENGIHLRHTLATFKAIPNNISFCGINGRIFGVDPEGNITACTRINTKSDRLAPLFHFGTYDGESNNFQFDDQAWKRIKHLIVDTISDCLDCFARHNCKGDCCHTRASAYGESFAIRKSPKCYANQLLTLGLFRLELDLPEIDYSIIPSDSQKQSTFQ